MRRVERPWSPLCTRLVRMQLRHRRDEPGHRDRLLEFVRKKEPSLDRGVNRGRHEGGS